MLVPPGGEALEDAKVRFSRAVEFIRGSCRGDAVIVTHADVMELFLGVPAPDYSGFLQVEVNDREAGEVFPPEYAEISVQMAEIKSSIQRHEQTIKEEAARKNDLITYLAHDLKTPLTSVVGYLSLLEEAPDMPEEQKAKYVHITLDKALRLEKLINEFFEITRYNLQQIVLEKETVDLTFMLVQMTDEFYPILQEHNNTIRVELPEEKEKLTCWFNGTESFVVPVEDIHKLVIEMWHFIEEYNSILA